MPDIAERGGPEGVGERLGRMRPEAKAQWGSFDAPRMMCHLSSALDEGVGDARGAAVGPWVLRHFPMKQLVVYAMPMPKGAKAPRNCCRGRRGIRRGSAGRAGTDGARGGEAEGDGIGAFFAGAAHQRSVERTELETHRPSLRQLGADRSGGAPSRFPHLPTSGRCGAPYSFAAALRSGRLLFFFNADCPKGEVRGVIRVAEILPAYFRMRMEECDAIFADDYGDESSGRR